MTSRVENQKSSVNFADDEKIVAAIKKAPLKYRLQLAALNSYLRDTKTSENNLKHQAREIITNYTHKKNLIIDESNAIISGERTVNGKELNYASYYLQQQEKTGNLLKELNQEPISEYWYRVIMNCSRVSGDVYEVDHELLKKIRKIESIPGTLNKFNFTLRFTFEANEYFQNETLAIKMVMSSQGDEIRRIEVPPIKWKEGKNFTVKLVQRKQQNKKTGATRFIKKVLPNDSFFRIFQSRRPNGTAKEQERILEEMEEILDLTQAFRDEILPYHIEYYLGKRKTALDFVNAFEDVVEDEKKDDKIKNWRKAMKEKLKGKKKDEKSKSKPEAEDKKVQNVKKEEEKKGCGVQ